LAQWTDCCTRVFNRPTVLSLGSGQLISHHTVNSVKMECVWYYGVLCIVLIRYQLRNYFVGNDQSHANVLVDLEDGV